MYCIPNANYVQSTSIKRKGYNSFNKTNYHTPTRLTTYYFMIVYFSQWYCRNYRAIIHICTIEGRSTTFCESQVVIPHIRSYRHFRPLGSRNFMRCVTLAKDREMNIYFLNSCYVCDGKPNLQWLHSREEIDTNETITPLSVIAKTVYSKHMSSDEAKISGQVSWRSRVNQVQTQSLWCPRSYFYS